MNISEQIKLLCKNENISLAELSRRIGCSPQNLNAKMRRKSFTISELEEIAKVVNVNFERNFILNNGNKI